MANNVCSGAVCWVGGSRWHVALTKSTKEAVSCFLGMSKQLRAFASRDGSRGLGESGDETWCEQPAVWVGSEFAMHVRKCVGPGSIGSKELSSCCQ